MPDYYEILGVSRTASDNEIKIAYKRIAMQFHPDRNKSADAESKFKSANEAYQTLGDTTKRAAYDKRRYTATTQPYGRTGHGSAYEYEMYKHTKWKYDEDDDLDLWDLVQKVKTQNQKYVISITLREAYIGTKVQLGKWKTMNVPAGVSTGQTLYSGTDAVEITVLPHTKFKRADNDLLVETSISVAEAVLGVDATITHIDGSTLKFKIPNGIQSGQVVRLSGKGMPSANSKNGDLLIRCTVEIPTCITEEQRDFFNQMQTRNSVII